MKWRTRQFSISLINVDVTYYQVSFNWELCLWIMKTVLFNVGIHLMKFTLTQSVDFSKWIGIYTQPGSVSHGNWTLISSNKRIDLHQIFQMGHVLIF